MIFYIQQCRDLSQTAEDDGFKDRGSAFIIVRHGHGIADDGESQTRRQAAETGVAICVGGRRGS